MMSDFDQSAAKLPAQITPEEFDRMFEAGEDISDYVDWENAEWVEPGKLSSGQKLAIIQSMLDDLLESPKSASLALSSEENLDVSVPSAILLQIGVEAARRGVSRESLVRSWIEQRVEEEKAKK